MKRLISLAIIAGVAGSLAPASAQVAWTFDPVSGPSGSLRGFLLDSPGGGTTDQYSTPYGFLFTYRGTPVWGYGINKTVTPGTASSDLFMQSYTVTNGQPVGQVFNARSDNGQLSIGPGISTNTGPRQVQVTAGTSTTPLDGVGVTTYGSHAGLSLGQGLTGKNFAAVNYAGLFQLGTDVADNGGGDFSLWDITHSTLPLQVNSTDLVTMNYGATINGTTTMNGPASLLGSTTTIGSAGALVGFYGGTPQQKFTLMGCRSDGTALANLIQKLQAMGLLTDQTTP